VRFKVTLTRPVFIRLPARSTLMSSRIVMTSAACFVDANGQFIAGRYNPLVGTGEGGHTNVVDAAAAAVRYMDGYMHVVALPLLKHRSSAAAA